MIDSLLKNCCYKCATPDVQVDVTEYVWPFGAYNHIYCSHYMVCKAYIEENNDGIEKDE